MAYSSTKQTGIKPRRIAFEHYRYTAFGEVEVYSPTGQKLDESAIGNTILSNSRRYDFDTGLYYYWRRHYGPRLARWLGRDPIEERGGINLYAFVGNEPIGRWDKYGHIFETAPIDKWADQGATGNTVWNSVDNQSYNISRSLKSIKETGSSVKLEAKLSGAYKALGLSATYSKTFSNKEQAIAASTSSFTFKFQIEEEFAEHVVHVTEWDTYWTRADWGPSGSKCQPGEIKLDFRLEGTATVPCNRTKCARPWTLREKAPVQEITAPWKSTGKFRMGGDAKGSGNSAAALRILGEAQAKKAAANWHSAQ